MINQRIVQIVAVEEVVDVVVVGVIVSGLFVWGWAVFDECLPTCVGV